MNELERGRPLNKYNLPYKSNFFYVRIGGHPLYREMCHVYKYTMTRGQAHSARSIKLAVSTCAIVRSGQQ
jgi:hypothetical protein